MTRATPEDRRLYIHSHFAWAAAFWGSARVAEQDGNFLLAPIGYYYSAFHSGFAAVCTNLDIPNESLKRMGHSQLKEYLEPIFPADAMISYLYLQDIREGINYLGVETPEQRVAVVRGHDFYFGSAPYFKCISNCREHSVRFLRHAQYVISIFGRSKAINYPDLNSEWWVQEFLGEDLFRCVIPGERNGQRALKLAFATELPSLLADTEHGN